jgi:hypothetical protein
MSDETNRIQLAAIKIKDLLETKDEVTLVKIDKEMNIDFAEYCSWQDTKSVAFASGKINLTEANYIYEKLGGSIEHFNALPLAEKVAITKVMSELLKWKMGL